MVCDSPGGCFRRLRTSASRQLVKVYSECVEAGQIVDREKVVNPWQCGLHATCQGLVARGPEEWIEPDEAIAASVETCHFRPEAFRISSIPSIGDQQHDRSPFQDSTGPRDVEVAQGVADTSTARPIRDMSRKRGDHVVGAALLQLSGHSGKSRGEKKRFDPAEPDGQRVHEVQQHTGVALHRSADVTEKNEWARMEPSPSTGQADDFTVSQTLTNGTSHVDDWTVARLPPSRPPLTRRPGESGEHGARLGDFFVGEGGEVLCARRVTCAVAEGRHLLET